MHKKRSLVDVDRLSFTSKKGQVTLFIILGIVILLAVVLVIIFRTEITTTKPGEVVPTTTGQVEAVITACIEEIGEDALFKVGLQGGYIDVPDHILNDKSKHLELAPTIVTPYWAYWQTTDIPSLDFIKEQLDDDVEQHLASCVFDPDKFLGIFDIVERGPVLADTEITSSGVEFNVEWNVEIRNAKGEVVSEVLNHKAESPVKLKDAYTMARRIVEVEMRDLKLEDITQDLIALEHPNVPVQGFEFSCSEKRWNVEDVKQSVKDLLRVNLRALQVSGSDILEYPDELTYYQNHYLWNIGDTFRNSDLSTTFTFEDSYPFSFQVTPQNGRYLKSNTMSQNSEFLSLLCMQGWKFSYDVSYPVLVKVRDETTGFDFKVAMTVHLQRNFPNRGESFLKTPPIHLSTYSDDVYCEDRSVPMMVRTFELIENPDTGVFIREPLPGVEISMTCVKYQCDIGESLYDFGGQGHVAAFQTNFPVCAGGIVRGEKEHYKEDWKRVVTQDGREIELDLVPEFRFPTSQVRVVTHNFDDGSVGPATELEDGVIALVSFHFDKEGTLLGPGRSHFHSSESLLGDIDADVAAAQTMTFLAHADFTYSTDVTLLKDNEYIGGYKGNWTVPWQQVLNAEEIVIHALDVSRLPQDEVALFSLSLAEQSNLVPVPEIR
ncbi:hypothetical protein CL620_01605 [archaeon]|nr:hypothetical protein [archaeon]